MGRIGIRELRQNASVWVARAQSGEIVDITNHGRLVARLVPAADADREDLIAAGKLVPARDRGKPFDPAGTLARRGDVAQTISEILQEQRDER